MVRVLKWLALAVAAAVLFVVVVWLASRATGPSAAESDALALIDAAPANQGRGGFAALYTVAHDVPEAEQAGVLAEDVRHFATAPLVPDGSSPPWRRTRKRAIHVANHYRRLEAMEWDDTDCAFGLAGNDPEQLLVTVPEPEPGRERSRPTGRPPDQTLR